MNSDAKAEIVQVTNYLRNSKDLLWVRLKQLLEGKDLDLNSLILAESFEDGDDLEFGVVVTRAGKVFKFDMSYLGKSIEQGEFISWEEISDSWTGSPYHNRIQSSLELFSEGKL